jgi:hypothetical protein
MAGGVEFGIADIGFTAESAENAEGRKVAEPGNKGKDTKFSEKADSHEN